MNDRQDRAPKPADEGMDAVRRDMEADIYRRADEEDRAAQTPMQPDEWVQIRGAELTELRATIERLQGEKERAELQSGLRKLSIEERNAQLSSLTEERDALKEEHDDELKAVWAEREHTVAALIEELTQARAERDALRGMVNRQAEDEGLWFEARTTPEAYLQQELRKLHAAIERG